VSISPSEVDRIGEPSSRSRGRLAPAAPCPRAHRHVVILCNTVPRTSPVRFPTLYGMCMRARHERERERFESVCRSAQVGRMCVAMVLRGGRAAEVGTIASFSSWYSTVSR
jgi:hypothetical protein